MPLWIAAKRDGGELPDQAIRAILDGAVAGRIPDYQLAALLMAIVWRGMSPRELATWMDAMITSGDRIVLDDIAGRKVDKHSTGGVGDKVSICLAPLVAACGVPVPMMAGRALGHTGGTLDKLESIPGFRTDLDPAAFRRVLRRTGMVLAGQSRRLVPADRLLYALRDATATVESIPLIASSILSKKVAEGADALVMDVKVGSGAFLPGRTQARRLARTLIDLGARSGLEVVALLTAMDQPLGREVGNASEIREAIEILAGGGPADTRALTIRLGAEMLLLGRAARDLSDGARRIQAAIASGAGLDRLRRCVEAQGGDPRAIDDPGRLPRARFAGRIRAGRSGTISRLDAGLIGRGATLLGAGRMSKEDTVDAAVGVSFHHKLGEAVTRGQPICTVFYNDPGRWQAARPLLMAACKVAPERPRRARLVLETLR
ncbi:MAG TPA: thymidine phosphorylase [Polyangia bacterium]|nr:thymidine phosphorylase [Polyangia bacterium]